MPRPIMLSIVGDSGSGKTTITRAWSGCSARSRSVTSALTTTTATTAGSGPSGRSRRCTRTATTWTSWRSTWGTCGSTSRCSSRSTSTRTEVRRAGLLRVGHALPGRRGPAHELRRPSCGTCSTCGSTSARRRSCGGSGRSASDCSRRGYSTDQVLAELDRREHDSEAFIRPQRHLADMVVSFTPGPTRRSGQHLDAQLFLRDSLPQPDLRGSIGERRGGRADPDRAPGEHGAADPRVDRARAGDRDRGGDLGPHALRASPAAAGAR